MLTLAHPRAHDIEPHAFDDRQERDRPALVPRPRVNLTTYHGILAPAATHRHRVVPEPVDDDEGDRSPSCEHARSSAPTESTTASRPDPARKRTPRLTWAELLQRVFLIDVLTCSKCGGKRRLLAAVTEPQAIRDILEHLHFPTAPPPIAPARAPPGELFL